MSVISMLALGSWNDGAGWPTCSIGTRERSTVETILAHFEVAQALSGPRSAALHARALAARAAARPRRLPGVRRPPGAARCARPRRRPGGERAPGAAPRRLVVGRARAVFRGSPEATSTPWVDRAGAGHQPPFGRRRQAPVALRFHPACADRRRDGELRGARRRGGPSRR